MQYSHYRTVQFNENSFRQILFCPGEFNFVSYDERLEDYLDSLELNGRELGPVFRSAQVSNKLLEISQSIMPHVYISNPKKVRVVMKPPEKRKDFLWIMTHFDTGKNGLS